MFLFDSLKKESFIKKFENTKQMYIEGNNFIFKYGTGFYKGKLLENNLKILFSDLKKTINYEGVIKEIEGNYFILLFLNDNYYFWTDKYGIIKIYFFKKDKNILISNLIFPIFEENKNLKINNLNLLEQSFQLCCMDNTTFLENVYKMKNSFMYQYNNLKLLKNKIEYNEENLNFSYEVKLNILINKLKEKAMYIKENYNKIALNMTGGLDSRLILSIYMSIGIKPTLLYGKGNSFITNTMNEDLKIVKKIAQKYNLELKIMDWSDNFENVIEDWNGLIKDYGELYTKYGGNKKIFDFYKNSEFDFIEFGCYGEMLRNISKLEKYGKRLTEEDIFDLYSFIDYKTISENYINLKEYFMLKINNIISKDYPIAREEYNKFDFFYSCMTDSSMINLINNIGISSCNLYTMVLDLAKNFNYFEKEGKKIFIDILKKFNPELLYDIEIFSGCQKMKYNGKTFIYVKVLERNIYVFKIYNFLKKYVNKSILINLGTFLLKNKKERKERKESKEYLSILIQKINEYQNCLNLKVIKIDKSFVGDMRMLLYFYQYLYLINFIKQGEK